VRVTGHLTPGDAVAWIGVASPSSPHRMESVQAGIFHIGRGTGCNLRLGDESIPERLAVIIADQKSARVSCLSDATPLLLNGEPVEESPLSDGDLLEAGPYTLVFRRIEATATAVQPEKMAVSRPDELTAPQLVEAIELEMDTVVELEQTPLDSLHELLRRSAAIQPLERNAERQVIPMNDVAALLRRLEQGQQRLRLQQEQILQQLSALTRQQDQFAAALDESTAGVVPLRPTSAPPRRASA